MQQLDISLNL